MGLIRPQAAYGDRVLSEAPEMYIPAMLATPVMARVLGRAVVSVVSSLLCHNTIIRWYGFSLPPVHWFA